MSESTTQPRRSALSVHTGGVRAFLAAPLAAGAVAIAWLGQAGFALRLGGRLVLIDPYLSDHLAQKYRDHGFSHERMMPTPIQAMDLPPVDAALCTHRHSDHMDAPTLREIAERSPGCVFVVPQAEREKAILAELPRERLVGAVVGHRVIVDDRTFITPIPAAHEELTVNQHGEHHFLGYVIRVGPLVLYHSGDCVPYDGLIEALSPLEIDVALLPVNGRDEARRAGGAPGNFHLHEAIDVCRRAGIPELIVHHFGMFAFNTVAPELLREQASRTVQPRVTVPSVDCYFLLEDRP